MWCCCAIFDESLDFVSDPGARLVRTRGWCLAPTGPSAASGERPAPQKVGRKRAESKSPVCRWALPEHASGTLERCSGCAYGDSTPPELPDHCSGIPIACVDPLREQPALQFCHCAEQGEHDLARGVLVSDCSDSETELIPRDL